MFYREIRLHDSLALTLPDGRPVRVVVVDVQGDVKVRLGVECSRDIPVDRIEVSEAKKRGPKP